MSTGRWETPQQVSGLQLAFPAHVVGTLMPEMSEIPPEFKNSNRPNKWVQLQRDWFFAGITQDKLKPIDGIDKTSALRHLAAIQGSFEPKHEHKEAAVAYLASLWFEADSTWEKIKKE